MLAVLPRMFVVQGVLNLNVGYAWIASITVLEGGLSDTVGLLPFFFKILILKCYSLLPEK